MRARGRTSARLTRPGRWPRRVATLLLAGVGVWGCDASNALVGGSCALGYADCGGQCVPLASDPDNCGACGNVCAGASCVAGSCLGRQDGGMDATPNGARRDAVTADGVADGTRNDASRDAGDASPFDGSRDAMRRDAPVEDATLDGTLVDAPLDVKGDAADVGVDQCAPPYDTVGSCGACGASCETTQVCTPVLDAGLDSGADAAVVYACGPACPDALSSCDGTCVDVTSDPQNCGACDRVCASGICVDGVCAGSALGDIVIIGHDYASANVRVSEGVLLANAVFLPPTNPLRVLSFEQYADVHQVANAEAVLQHAATTSGRQVSFTPVTDYTAIPADLASTSYDVLLVHDQPNAPPDSLGMVGSSLKASLGMFVAIGGDVVVLDGASGPNPQMTALLSSSSLLQTTTETHVPSGTQLFVVASGDAVGNFVVSPYAAQTDTVSFVTSETNGGNVTFVVESGADASAVPVVIHKTP